jgi:hypothetical protein
MSKLKAIAVAVVASTFVMSAAASAQCVNKAGEGTGGNRENASFQAWEAVLQATSWGSWSQWISSGGKVGTAPGYKVSKVSTRCSAGGLGQVCVMQATLCR